MSNLEKGQECYLHKGNESRVFKFGTVEYKEATKDGWVSSVAEARGQIKQEIVEDALGDDTELKAMSLKELRILAKKLGICCVSKSKADEVIAKITEFYDENKNNTNT